MDAEPKSYRFEDEYDAIIREALRSPERTTRNAVTRSFFGGKITISNLHRGIFPLITKRKMYHKGILGEFAAFMNQPQSVEDFEKFGCNYWSQFGDEKGNLVVDYGNAWLNYNGVNQLKDLVKSLKEDPMSRRHVISAWRPDRLAKLSLPCCHYAYQWYVTSDGFLEMLWHQRSVDIMVGLPSDIVLAALWNILLAKQVGLKPGVIHMIFGDCHIYETHEHSAKIFLARKRHQLPLFTLKDESDLFSFKPSDFILEDYNHGGPMDFELVK